MNTIIFDMGMVLVDFRWKALLKDMGMEEEKVKKVGEAVFQNPLWHQFDWGIMGDENVLSQMKKESPEYEEEINNIWDNFKHVCKMYDYSEELVKTLHEKGYQIYILSNFGKTLLELDREDFTFLNYVDGGVVSYAVQQMKPNEDIYQTLLDKYEIEPDDAVFFDDNLDNCEAARKLGITAVEVHGLQTILDGIEKYFQIELPDIRRKYCG